MPVTQHEVPFNQFLSFVDGTRALQLTLGVHFILVSIAMIGYWVPFAYVFYNAFLLLGLFWSLFRPDEVNVLQHTVFLNGFAIIADIIVMIGRYHYSSFIDGFSLAFCILNLLARPIGCIFLMRVRGERETNSYQQPYGGGAQRPGFGGSYDHYADLPPAAPHIGSYENAHDTRPLAP